MKKQTLALVGAGLALLVGGVYVGSLFGKGDAAKGGGTEPAGKQTASISAANSSGSGIMKVPKARGGDNPWAALTEKYGDSRTKLSKKITEDMSGLLNDVMEIADSGAALQGAGSAKELATRQLTNSLASRLSLNEEQKAKASEIVESGVAARTDALKALSGALESDPASMMETILAGDALKRGEMTQEEYDATASETLAVMRQVGGYAFSGMGGGGGGVDAQMAEQLNPILNEEQRVQLAELVGETSKRAQGGNQQLPLLNGALPAMKLEDLDQTMISAQKMTVGIKAMMEGFQGFQGIDGMKGLAPEQ